MDSFDVHHRTRFVFGENAVDKIGDLARTVTPGRRVMVVADPGIVEAGHFDVVTRRLSDAGFEIQAFHDFGENPTSAMVDAGVACAASFQPELLIGLGGGSSMDCAKGINFVYSCGGSIHDYHGVGKATSDLLPLIAIPTTAGTGSEAQSFALISDADTHVKMACGDPRAACRIAVLDPVLTLTQPANVTALTGIDAISHAIETYVSKRRNPMSCMVSRRAMGLLAGAFETVLDDPDNLPARADMQLGACLSGMAIETSMLGAAHATANPLTANHDVVHGQAVGLMLPPVIRLNGTKHAAWYAELVSEIQPISEPSTAPEILANLVTGWMEAADLATTLEDLLIPSSDIGQFVDEALQQWTGTFNPIALDEDTVRSLYRDVV
ncbi:MAG: iron-containing alcohol dehydrogenase [Planctomycetota bacterium]